MPQQLPLLIPPPTPAPHRSAARPPRRRRDTRDDRMARTYLDALKQLLAPAGGARRGEARRNG